MWFLILLVFFFFLGGGGGDDKMFYLHDLQKFENEQQTWQNVFFFQEDTIRRIKS